MTGLGKVHKIRRAKVVFAYAAENPGELSLMPGLVRMGGVNERNITPSSVSEALLNLVIVVSVITLRQASCIN